MAKKAKKSAKAKPKAVKKAQVSRSSKKRPVKKITAKNQAYQSPPKDIVATPKSVTIPLQESEPQEISTISSFAPSIPAPIQESPTMASVSRTSSGIHSYGALVFLLLAGVGYWFSLIFVSNSQWLSFLFALAVMVICLDTFMASLYRRQEAKHPLDPPGIQNLHQLTMHLFLLLALIAVVFAVAFWLQGRWIMLLLSIGAAVVAFDNMIVAKKKHETH